MGYADVPKLVAPEISLGGNYSFDFDGRFYSTTTVYGYVKRDGFPGSYYTWMAILNSKLCWWFLKQTGTVLANGYYRYKPAYLKPFPIPVIPEEIDFLLKQYAKDLMTGNSTNNKDLNVREIDRIVYVLYGLSDGEIRLVENC